MRAEQEVLLQMPEQPEAEQREVVSVKPKLLTANRAQLVMAAMDLEDLIGAEHPARAIWELSGQMDLSRFGDGNKSWEGGSGRPRWDPRLLVSVWVYGYSRGIRSARELAELMGHEPGLLWLSGREEINHHTLSDFRVQNQAGLDSVFQQLLALLERAGVVNLERLMQDGTKIRAQASPQSFRGEKSLRESFERAKQVMEQAGDPRQEPKPERQRKARERAEREQKERLEQALEEWQRLQAEKPKAEQEKVKVSRSEPESRLMKQPDGGYAPSYNVQISTDAEAEIIVAVGVSQARADVQEFEAALQRVEENLGRAPQQVVVDGGYESRGTILQAAERKIDLIMPAHTSQQRAATVLKGQGGAEEFGPAAFVWEEGRDTMRCPAGEQLERSGQESRQPGQVIYYYRAVGGACQRCAHQTRCCPKKPEQGRRVGRVVQELPAIIEFHEKMAKPEARQIYRQRGEVAEFPNAWIKEKIGLRRFLVRGKRKAYMEVMWASLSYNVSQWFRLIWRPLRLSLAT